MDTAYIGVNGHVLAIDKRAGGIRWQTRLGGSFSSCGFVSIATDGEQVFAHTNGKLFCLEARTGRLLWSNALPGMGYGVATICATLGTAAGVPEYYHEQQSESAAPSS